MSSSASAEGSVIWCGSLAVPSSLACPLLEVDHSTLEDIKLWTSHRHSFSKAVGRIDGLRAVSYVNPCKLPVWCVSGGALRVSTANDLTLRFFNSLAASSACPPAPAITNLGLLVEVCLQQSHTSSRRPDHTPQYLLFAIEWIANPDSPEVTMTPVVCAIPITLRDPLRSSRDHLSVKMESDANPRFLPSLPRKSLPSAKSLAPTPPATGSQRSNTTLDNLVLPRRSSTPFERAAVRKPTGKENIYKPSLRPETHIERQAKALVQRVTMAGLRLRGIHRDNPEYSSLHSHVYSAATFALRHRLDSSISLGIIEDKVESLLDIFIGTTGKLNE